MGRGVDAGAGDIASDVVDSGYASIVRTDTFLNSSADMVVEANGGGRTNCENRDGRYGRKIDGGGTTESGSECMIWAGVLLAGTIMKWDDN